MLKQILWPILALLSSSSLQALDCGTAQRQLLSLSEENQDRLQIENREYSDLQSFVTSKPELAPARIVTGSLTVQGEAYEQLWCKMKSQDAVLAIAKVSSEGPALDCRDLNRKQLEEALRDIQDDHSQSNLESLGIQLESDKDFSTGAQWAPSKLGMSKSDGVIRIQAMRLKSATWIPIVGGMNYCKLLSPAGAMQVIKDQLAQQESRPRNARTEVEFQKVEWTGAAASKQSALVLKLDNAEQSLQSAKASFIISPGAEIPAQAMSGLAKLLSNLGYLTLVVEYPNNTAIFDTLLGRGNSAINLAQKIKNSPLDIRGLPISLMQNKPVYVLGHSLGGASLADEVYRSDKASIFDHIFLYGTSSFVKFGGSNVPTSSPLTFLFGENDGLSSRDIPGILKSFDIAYDPNVFVPVSSASYSNLSYQRLKGLNHFCIVSDQSVGNAGLKKKDGPGLQPEECLKALVQALSL